MSSLDFVQDGDRVYLDDNQMYGEVLKKGFLGLNRAVVMECDDGTRKAYCGDLASQHVIKKETGQNGKGDIVSIPTDVKEVGPSILTAMGIPPEDQGSLYQKFIALEPSVQQEKIQYWVDNNSDSEKMAVFFSELIPMLESDDLFVATQAAIMLRHMDETSRLAMADKLYASTTSVERRDMILRYTENRASRVKTEEFLQDMYERFLADNLYLKMEFRKALFKLRIFDPEASEAIDAFLSSQNDTELANIAIDWRQKKLFRSKLAPTYTHKLIKPFL